METDIFMAELQRGPYFEPNKSRGSDIAHRQRFRCEEEQEEDAAIDQTGRKARSGQFEGATTTQSHA